MGSKNSIDVSVVVPVTTNLRYLGATARSIQAAAALAAESKISSEVILTLLPEAGVSPAMSGQYFDHPVKTIELSSISLAHVRNQAVQQSRGKYITFVNQRDLIGRNWIKTAYEFAQSVGNEKAILQPKILVFFDESNEFYVQPDQSDISNLKHALFDTNVWSCQTFALTEIHKRLPFDERQFAAEQALEGWHWNCEAAAHGLEHKTVPGTMYFMHASSDRQNLLKRSSAGSKRRAPSSLFDPFATNAELVQK